MKTLVKKTLLILLSLILAFGVFLSWPIPAQAIIIYNSTGGGDYTFYIGQYDTTVEYIAAHTPLLRAVVTQDIPAETGIVSDDWGGNGKCFKGTALPGTTGDYTVKVKDPGDNDEKTYTITVAPGPQTITPISNFTKRIGDANFTVTPQSTNGNGDVIPAGSTDAPTYAFSVNSAGVVSIASNGEVTIIGQGTTTVTISSTATNSYTAATPITVGITVNKYDPAVSLVGASPTGTAGAVGDKTITVTVSGSYNENISFSADINGIQKTASRSGDGNVSFSFTAVELNALAAGNYPITVSSAETASNSAIAATQVGMLTVTDALDTTPPSLTMGTVSRTSHNAASVSFTSNEAGTYYYLVKDSTETAPT